MDEWARGKIKTISVSVLDGTLSLIEAVRALSRVVGTGDLEGNEVITTEDLRSIIGINSETDTLPVGDVRRLWMPSALIEKDREIAHAEELYGDDLRGICRRLLSRLEELSQSRS